MIILIFYRILLSNCKLNKIIWTMYIQYLNLTNHKYYIPKCQYFEVSVFFLLSDWYMATQNVWKSTVRMFLYHCMKSYNRYKKDTLRIYSNYVPIVNRYCFEFALSLKIALFQERIAIFALSLFRSQKTIDSLEKPKSEFPTLHWTT